MRRTVGLSAVLFAGLIMAACVPPGTPVEPVDTTLPYTNNAEKKIELHVVVDSAQWVAMGQDETVLRNELYAVFSRVNEMFASITSTTIDVNVTDVTVFNVDPYGLTRYPDALDSEVNVADLLTDFTTWKNAQGLGDFAMLYSALDFEGSVLAYAQVAGSSSIVQATSDDDYHNALTVAHSLGHNLGMQHDSAGNACPASGYVMAAVMSGVPPSGFSSCSQSSYDSYLSTNRAFLDNIPTRDFFTEHRAINYVGDN
ncbi:MAG: hypothetical protein E4H09_03985 [Spirochaetales bacterium]|nr:MAG: hypothetical protein E4H09_03985 [Spirochaetales bacterium]